MLITWRMTACKISDVVQLIKSDMFVVVDYNNYSLWFYLKYMQYTQYDTIRVTEGGRSTNLLI